MNAVSAMRDRNGKTSTYLYHLSPGQGEEDTLGMPSLRSCGIPRGPRFGAGLNDEIKQREMSRPTPGMGQTDRGQEVAPDLRPKKGQGEEGSRVPFGAEAKEGNYGPILRQKTQGDKAMIRLKKKSSPPEHLPELAEIKRFWSTKEAGGVVIVDQRGEEYTLLYSDLLKFYDVGDFVP